jgi:CTP:molybdopterin cytidylyltransferase MocA
MHVTGIVLAAGAGVRAGGPKARRPGWLEASVALLLDAGCDRVIVALGAAPEAPVPTDSRVTAIVVDDWNKGMSHSLRAALTAAADGQPAIAGDSAAPPAPPPSPSPAPAPPPAPLPRAALVTLVDYPDLPLAVAARVLAAAGSLRQAVFSGRPGHPVFIAEEHWQPLSRHLAQQSTADRGARPYLANHDVVEVECGDLWHGRDRDD